MNITLIESKIQFKNPVLGHPTRAIEEHYHARRVVAIVDGEERHFRFTKDELTFSSTEDEMIDLIANQINADSESA